MPKNPFEPKTDIEKMQDELAQHRAVLKAVMAYIAHLPGAGAVIPPFVSNAAKEMTFRTPSWSPVLPGEVEAWGAMKIQELARKIAGLDDDPSSGDGDAPSKVA